MFRVRFLKGFGGGGKWTEGMARIVIADDHEIVRSGLKALLEDAGWQVCGEAENGEEAVKKVSELQPDLVILDISMPVMNGFQAAQAIRELAPEIKIALFSMHDLAPFWSGSVSSWSKNPSFTFAADAYLMKTARSEQIVYTISQLLESKRTSGRRGVGATPLGPIRSN